MTTIQIEKGVPMPNRTHLPELPFTAMEIGDSFVAPVLSSDARSIQALRQRVTRFQKQNPPKKFSVVQDGEQVRVFRVI